MWRIIEFSCIEERRSFPEGKERRFLLDGPAGAGAVTGPGGC